MYDETELRGRRLGELFPEDDAAKLHGLRAGFARGAYPQAIDLRIRRRDGAIITLSVNFNSVLREEGATLCSFRDVTEERAVAAELVKTKDFLQRVIDSSVDAIISADMHGTVLLFNRAAERIYGRSQQEMIGSDVRKMYPEGVAHQIMRAMRTGSGKIEGLKTEIVDAQADRVPVLISAALILEGSTAVGSVGIFTDLRERMRMEQKLAQAQEQLIAQERQAIIAELAGAAAHELNQPLTSVMGFAELLKRKLALLPSPANVEDLGKAAEVIFSEAERMAEIVRKIGKITRYETRPYVGRARILDLDKATQSEPSEGIEEGASRETATPTSDAK